MANVLGMNRYMNEEGIRGMGVAANLQNQREITKNNLAAAKDSTKKASMSSMGGSGMMLGYGAGAGKTLGGTPAVVAAGPQTNVAGLAAGQNGLIADGGVTGNATVGTAATDAVTTAGTTAATDATTATGTAALTDAAATSTGTVLGETAVAGGLAETAGTAGLALGPVGAIGGLALGALAGWLMSK
jgi:hypothetical protein